jgi:hypothetical protein
VPRTESYTKEWASVSLGALELPRARGALRLRVVHQPGSGGLEVAEVVLVRR